MKNNRYIWIILLLTVLSISACDALGEEGNFSELSATATAAALPQGMLEGGASSSLEQAIALTRAADENGAAPQTEQATDTAVPTFTTTATSEPATPTATNTSAPTAARTDTPEPEPDDKPGASPTSAEASLDPPATTAGDPPCNAMRFVADVTVPDGSAMKGQQEFYKVWRVQNMGTCIWTRDYAIHYYGGFQLGAPTSTMLDVNVAPGQYTNLGLKMFSPAQSGTFRSEWMLADYTGQPFGIGDEYDQPFYVEIYVSGGG